MAIDAPLTIERKDGKAPGTVIFRLKVPSPYATCSTSNRCCAAATLRPLTIIDLNEVPYMDSTGMGMIVNHFVRCQGKGAKLIVAGVSPRVLELFKLTKVDTVIPITATAEEAEARV